ncbi:DDE-type integrase/transposase/recombinase [Endozoicomonas ascidiicola]|uniref:DDE-type integrase/transposase/recombinase n=1 Tax=Endozoicomonas ascidiicola TaxID=1698521 RepID=UPI0008312B7D|nr:DDE-type integrase/transposase/recombinase [Endozoicomonas ascidiicola]
MNIEINSVWSFNGIEGIPDGCYRVLKFYEEFEELIIFPIKDESTIQRPISCDVEIFAIEYNEGNIKEFHFELPWYLLVSETDIPEIHRITRDLNFSLIKPLIEDKGFYHDLVVSQRVKSISKRAKEISKPVQTLYRVLNNFWKYGQDASALIPAFKDRGGKGKERVAGDKKRGAPVKSRTGVIEVAPGINITEEDKKKIEKGLKKFYLNSKRMSLAKAYKNTIKAYYAKEVREAEVNGDFPKIPNQDQFKEWKNILTKKSDETKKRSTKRHYQKNERGLLGSALEDAAIPGECFELDATVADVHIVSKLNRNLCLGRPTIYLVVDKTSRMIVGVHVSMEYASWRAGRQALINSFTEKKTFCEKYGITITDSQWPCYHLPRRLLCDRGEMVCKKPEELVVPLMQLDIAAPYRADMKGIVERRFGLLNEEVFHQLVGTTRGTIRIRGEDDPRDRAQYTIDELTKETIKEIRKHNRKIFDNLKTASPLLMENSLAATPINCWKIHLQKHRHSLRIAEEEEIRAKLLPSVTASMTKYGILYNGVYYSCERVKEENLAAIARNHGRWSLEARADLDNSSFLYVRLKHGEGFTKCHILPRSKMLADLPESDIDCFHDWHRQQDKKNEFTSEDISDFEESRDDARYSAQEQKKAPKNANKKDKKTGIKDRRREAIEQGRKELQDEKSKVLEEVITSPESGNIADTQNNSGKNSMFSRSRRRKE